MTQWKLVPIEPTLDMKLASGIPVHTAGLIWRDMLAAAPSPPEELVEEIAEIIRGTVTTYLGDQGFPALSYDRTARVIIAKLRGKP